MPPSRKIVITGAAGALGRVVAERFIRAGDSVTAIHAPGSTPPSIEGAQWAAVDLSDRDSTRAFFASRADTDAVVHCAGGFRWSRIEDTGAEDFRFLASANFESSFQVAAAAVPAMRKRKDGVLLFISSIATLKPAAGMSAYAATKAAVNAMVTTLAEELKADGVRVNALLPSMIDTPANRKDMPDGDPSQWVAPADLAELLYDLTLPKSRSVTGALIPVTGKL
jgi:NAD(P)-dependent dehydrogenase (short-subunit alcohol dehydrogenase family)